MTKQDKIENSGESVVHTDSRMILRYRLSSSNRNSFHRGKDIRLTWSVENPIPDFSGFALVANGQRIPLSISDGIEIFRWTPEKDEVMGVHRVRISLEPIQSRRWAHFCCKAMLMDHSQSDSILIIHPNTCIPISDRGEILRIGTNGKRKYRGGVPDTITCPTCFKEFPINVMLFTSNDPKEKPIPGKYTLIDRLLGRPVQPPKNEKGKILTIKTCPESKYHILPATAGTREILIIGFVASKYSGKTTYLTSLMEWLTNRASNDFEISITPATEETKEIFERELYYYLFEHRLQLGVTVGTPPPLIYDLTIDGKLWGGKKIALGKGLNIDGKFKIPLDGRLFGVKQGQPVTLAFHHTAGQMPMFAVLKNQKRSVTLVFYHTAGENFDEPEVVRKMVRYLKVASGLIFVIDPLKFEAVCNQLPDSAPKHQFGGELSPKEIIDRCMMEMENEVVVAQAGKFSIPIACVFTMCDVLRDYGLIDPNRLWCSDRVHKGHFNIEAHNDMTGMMGEYMQRWCPAAYNTIRQKFSRHAFFGVSATGCAPAKKTGIYDFISPWRVEDPLLWLLYELGVIPGR
ncbi:MAG: hypothetical protein K8T10_22000 [Candidatus Eremiobacteraeota bacterium]|nr:hypothetical protein [Candidatus Eremiobacteraeota bacterium]